MFKLTVSVLLFALSLPLAAQNAALQKEAQSVLPDAYKLYEDLHQNPELSSHETRTAATLAARLKALGYEVTENVGGTGIVAVMKNGAGPTVLLRTELDALPVPEKTGLPYASKVVAKDPTGKDVPVMHACGHDVHMASLIGTAQVMAQSKSTWHGTLVIIVQPAEETVAGAKGMVDAGLLTKFPKPDVLVALHVGNDLPAGKVGYGTGYVSSNADSVRITIFGRGAHGSMPQNSIDPIVLGAKIVLALQTIASREVAPGERVVVTVGYFQSGLKNNIIPDEAKLGLTVRTFDPEVRKQVLAAISRIVRGEAEAAGVKKLPEVVHDDGTDSVYNDPALAARMAKVLDVALGKNNVEQEPPWMASEDFSYFVQQGIPGFYFSLGGANPEKYAQAKASGEFLPSNHSPLFAPDAKPAIETGIAAEVAVLRDLLNTPPAELKQFVGK